MVSKLEFFMTMLMSASLGAGAAIAGGMSSTGSGDLPSDLTNPWWVDNSKVVSYCIDYDAVNFGAPVDSARTQIVKALAYWRDEFADADLNSSELPLHLASQQFVEQPCRADIDLRFQLGTMLPDQSSSLKHTDRLIGEAVRTSYDPEQLRAKGFIYISPETGPLALTGLGDWNGPIRPKRWTVADGKILEMILIHELGHVFGLQHQYGMNIMDATMPAILVSYPSAYGITPATAIMRTIPRPQVLLATQYNTEDTGGLNAAHWAPILGGDSADLYVELRPLGTTALQVYAGPARGGPLRLLGTGTRLPDPDAGFSESQPLVQLYLTPEQKAFSLAIPAGGHLAQLFIPTRVVRPVSYVIASTGATRNLLLEARPGFISLMGVSEHGAIQSVLGATEWIFDRSLLPPEAPKVGVGGTSLPSPAGLRSLGR